MDPWSGYYSVFSIIRAGFRVWAGDVGGLGGLVIAIRMYAVHREDIYVGCTINDKKHIMKILNQFNQPIHNHLLTPLDEV